MHCNPSPALTDIDPLFSRRSVVILAFGPKETCFWGIGSSRACDGDQSLAIFNSASILDVLSSPFPWIYFCWEARLDFFYGCILIPYLHWPILGSFLEGLSSFFLGGGCKDSYWNDVYIKLNVRTLDVCVCTKILLLIVLCVHICGSIRGQVPWLRPSTRELLFFFHFLILELDRELDIWYHSNWYVQFALVRYPRLSNAISKPDWIIGTNDLINRVDWLDLFRSFSSSCCERHTCPIRRHDVMAVQFDIRNQRPRKPHW